MLSEETLATGVTVRLTTPYLDAKRGLYLVAYVYRNGWLCLLAEGDGRRFHVPARLCRQVETRGGASD